MAIYDCFRALLTRLQSTPTQLSNLDRHGDEIKTCLTANLALHSVKRLGSHSRDTAIALSSDLDLFALFPRSEAMYGGRYVTSTTMLDRVRTALQTRYRYTDISRDGQAIVVRFTDGGIVDVVPAIFDSMHLINQVNRPVYLIPDGDGDWMATSPEAHAHYITQAHAPSGGKFPSCIRLLKCWRESRTPSVPMSSFHLELLFASEGTFRGVNTYQDCLYGAFLLLHQRGCRAIQDPLGISGLVRSAKTPTQVSTNQTHVGHALDKTIQAISAEQAGNLREAHAYWNMVFNGNFPAL